MPAGFNRVDVLGCPFDAISAAETAALVRTTIRDGARLHIVTANVDFVMKARRDPSFAEELWRSDCVVADGVPILWAAKALGSPLRGRVNGTDLVWTCAEITRELGCGIALIGGAAEITERAAVALRGHAPGAIIHVIPTPFPLDAAASEQIAGEIKRLGAKIVLVALGAPRQERWLQTYLAASGASIGIGIGSALDIISGDRPRAPELFQRNGLEWLHRMVLEPRRLGRRYLIEDSPFVLHAGAAILRRWAIRRRARQ
jgi:N-acetylglucosaminyldiphosphoundecaprenol N-acetyl-beta-D-mannosaminyltransferase